MMPDVVGTPGRIDGSAPGVERAAGLGFRSEGGGPGSWPGRLSRGPGDSVGSQAIRTAYAVIAPPL